MSKPIIAIMYDFDKTLSTTDMQSYSFIPALGMSADEFWGETGKFSKATGTERILSYMYMMIVKCREKNINLTHEYLKECGKNIKFHPGVTTWFDRINKYGEDNGIQIEHYLVSSGTKEIVEGCAIYDKFTNVYGCEYLFDESGHPVWPKFAINYTQKTQFFFRIAKGVYDTNNDDSVNEKSLKLRIPYDHIVYIGDGMTDVACMTLVNKNKGYSIGVYTDDNKEKVKRIREEKRCRFVVKADYSADKQMEKVLKLIIDDVHLRHTLEKKEEDLAAL